MNGFAYRFPNAHKKAVVMSYDDGSEHDYQFDFDPKTGRWEFAERDLLERDFGEVPVVDANESRLGQVFLNLLVNAVQAMPERPASENRIRVRTYTDAAGWAVVEVERPGIAWYDPKVQLRSGKRHIELGRFLTGDEKHQLAEQLKSAIKKHSAL